jgi:tetratricopeptide (TPR) repeat protein
MHKMPSTPKPTKPTKLDPGGMKRWRTCLERWTGDTGNNSSDPEYGKYWGFLADAYVSDYLNRWNEAKNDPLPQQAMALLQQTEDAAMQAFRNDWKDLGTHYAMGMLYRAQGKHPLALAEFWVAFNGDSTQPRFVAQYANQLINIGKPDQALPVIDDPKILNSNDPASGIFYWILGRANFFLGNLAAAITALETSVKTRPCLWFNQAYLISAYALAGNSVDAGTALTALNTTFSSPQFTVKIITKYEQEIPNDNNKIITDGLTNFHAGLLRAQMPAQ